MLISIELKKKSVVNYTMHEITILKHTEDPDARYSPVLNIFVYHCTNADPSENDWIRTEICQ